MSNTIRQPNDVTVTVNGTATGELRWSRSFSRQWGERYRRAQIFMDSEVLRLNDRYVPFRQGGLKRSGIQGTTVGSGMVRYIAPYARYQYQGKLMVGPAPKQLTSIPLRYHSGDANRGAKWFEVMKARHGAEIIRGVRRIVGRQK